MVSRTQILPFKEGTANEFFMVLCPFLLPSGLFYRNFPTIEEAVEFRRSLDRTTG